MTLTLRQGHPFDLCDVEGPGLARVGAGGAVVVVVVGRVERQRPCSQRFHDRKGGRRVRGGGGEGV